MLPEMARHTTFRFCVAPTVEQRAVLARNVGASRFAFNQCLRMVKTALTQRHRDPDVDLPWTGFDLINAFNAWKKTEDAGRVISVDSSGVAEVAVTGLAWRGEVCQQVFEEAAVDLGRALSAWTESRRGKRRGGKVGHPALQAQDREARFVPHPQQDEQERPVLDPGRRRSPALSRASWGRHHPRVR
jgi:putative transposase